MLSDEQLAVEGVARILEVGAKADYAALMIVVRRHSMQWLVDVYQGADPHAMAISVPSILASFPSAEEQVDTSMDDASWENIKCSISQAVSDYLK